MLYQSDFWSDIKNTELPIVLYGTGNGADWVLDEFEKRSIHPQGLFASDGFVRDRYFRGYKVISYSEARKIFGKMAVVLCFGSHKEDVIENIISISSENDLYMPDMLRDEQGHLFDLVYCHEHKAEMEWAYSLLIDDVSRASFKAVIDFRLSGKIDYLLSHQEDITTSWKLLGISDEEFFVDCGAYNGDTIERLLSIANGYGFIYGFEPDAKTFNKLVRNTSSLSNLELYNSFVSDRNGHVSFSSGKGRGSKGSGLCDVSIPSITIDSALKGRKATVIKYDTEGFELEALEGGRRTISTYKPRLILSAYHKIDDLWTLPRKVLGLYPDYKFMFRNTKALPYWDSCYYVSPF